MGTVEISGVDVVHPARNSFLQYGNRFLDISGRPPYQFAAITPRKLHGSVAHAIYCHWSARQREAPREIHLFNHFVPPDPVYSLLKEGSQKHSPTISSLFFQSASAVFASTA